MTRAGQNDGPRACEWALWRQDDNGNRFEMRRSRSRAELEVLEAIYDARGHKQLYWIEAVDATKSAELGTHAVGSSSAGEQGAGR